RAPCRGYYAARFRWSANGPRDCLRLDARGIGVLPRSGRKSPGIHRDAPPGTTARIRDHAVANVGTPGLYTITDGAYQPVFMTHDERTFMVVASRNLEALREQALTVGLSKR